MKNILLLLILISQGLFAHKNVIVEKTYGNVNVMASTSVYKEKMYTAFIAGQYAEVLANKYGFTDKINLYFLETRPSHEKLVVYYTKANPKDSVFDNSLTLLISKEDFNVGKALSLLEFSIRNFKKIEKKDRELNKAFEAPLSDRVSEILKARIYRPSEVPELDKKGFSYYFENNKFHFYSTYDTNAIKYGEVIYETDKVFYYEWAGYNLLVVFNDIGIIQVINVGNDSKNTSLRIKNTDTKYLLPHSVKLIDEDKILFSFKELLYTDVAMIYFMEKKLFVEDLDSLVK